MKKICAIMVFFVFLGLPAFGDAGGQEEIDFLLFAPNSSDAFADEAQAMFQLDGLARYLLARSLEPGQIHVHGYTADALTDIEPVSLSRDRAVFVMRELQARGVLPVLFSEPVAHGAVDLWGANTGEDDRRPNRRVRITVDGVAITQAALIAAYEEIETAVYDIPAQPRGRFPWEILLLILPLLAAAALLAARRKRKSVGKASAASPAEAASLAGAASAGAAVPTVETAAAQTAGAAPTAPTAAEAVALTTAGAAAASTAGAAPTVPTAAEAVALTTDSHCVCLEEAIRCRAYELYLERGGGHGNADEDWHKAALEICGQYEADGYAACIENGCWWARR